MDVHVPSARETCRFYDKAQHYSSDLKSKIEASWSKVFLHRIYIHMFMVKVLRGNCSSRYMICLVYLMGR